MKTYSAVATDDLNRFADRTSLWKKAPDSEEVITVTVELVIPRVRRKYTNE